MEFNNDDDFTLTPTNLSHSAAQNGFVQNPTSESHGFLSPMNQYHYGYRSPGCSYLNSTETGIYSQEDLEAMNGLQLSNYLDLSVNFGSLSLSHQDQQQLQLQRMRVGSAVRGQQLAPPSRPQYSVQFTAANNCTLQDLYNDPYPLNYSAIAHHQSTNFQNEIRNMAAANFPSGVTSRVPVNHSVSRYHNEIGLQFLGPQQHQNFSSLEDSRKVAFLAKEYYPYENHYSQKNFDVERQMEDHSKNDLIQKILSAISNRVLMPRTIALLVQDDQKLKDLCIDKQGSVAMQNLLVNLQTSEQVNRVILGLKRITVTLTKNTYGGGVIVKCLQLFSPALTQPLVDEVMGNCVGLATHKIGCSVINNYLGVLKGQVKLRLINEIISYAINLAEDPYGNYVVQYVVKMMIPPINASIISQLAGAYVQLSMNKHASHVVEDLIKSSHESHAETIILEIMNSDQFLNVLQDPFGNYVAQTALKHSKGALLETFSLKVLNHRPFLHSHLYGKKVLKAFGKGGFKTLV